MKITKRALFNISLKEFIKNNNCTVVTCNGDPVRILDWDIHTYVDDVYNSKNNSIVCAIFKHRTNARYEYVRVYHLDDKGFIGDWTDSKNDSDDYQLYVVIEEEVDEEDVWENSKDVLTLEEFEFFLKAFKLEKRFDGNTVEEKLQSVKKYIGEIKQLVELREKLESYEKI